MNPIGSSNYQVSTALTPPPTMGTSPTEENKFEKLLKGIVDDETLQDLQESSKDFDVWFLEKETDEVLKKVIESGNAQLFKEVIDLFHQEFDEEFKPLPSTFYHMSRNPEMVKLLIEHPYWDRVEIDTRQFVESLCCRALDNSDYDTLKKLVEECGGTISDESLITLIPLNISEKDTTFEMVNKSIELLRGKAWAPPELLIKGILCENSYLVNHSLKYIKPDEICLEDREKIWSAVILTKDSNFFERILYWGLDTELKDSKHLADILLMEQSPSFRKTALQILCDQLNFDLEKKRQLYQQAIEWGDIDVSQQLWDNFSSEIQFLEKEPLHALLVDIDPNQERDNFIARIQLIALMSPLDSFLSWSKTLAKNVDQSTKDLVVRVTDDYLTWAPYISHYTGPRFMRTNELYRGDCQNSLLNAVRSQVSYAQKMLHFVEQSQPEIHKKNMMKLIKIWAKENAQYKFDGDFCAFRDTESTKKRLARRSMYNRVKDYGWMITRSVRANTELTDYIAKCYYSFCRPAIMRTYQQGLQETTNNNVDIKSSNDSLRYNLISRNGDSLTSVIANADGFWSWSHPCEVTVQRQYPELEKLHQKLLKLPLGSVEDRKTFQKVLAEAYWLLCQTMPTARGTSQYSQNYLAFICAERGFHPPIPSKEYPEPNPLVISMTREECVERFPEFFDSFLSPKG